MRTVLWLVDSNGRITQTPLTFQRCSDGSSEKQIQHSQELELEVESLLFQIRTLEDKLSAATGESAVDELKGEVARL